MSGPAAIAFVLAGASVMPAAPLWYSVLRTLVTQHLRRSMVWKKLRLGLPSGSLQERTLALFRQAGYRITLNDRSYVPHIDDSELEGLLIRAQEIPHYVESGVLDAGITGLDWIKERDAAVVEVAELAYSRNTDRPARWVLAVPDDSPVQRPEDLQARGLRPSWCASPDAIWRSVAWRPRSSSRGGQPRSRRRSWPTRLWS